MRWFLRVFFQTTYYQPSRALFISNVACNLLHDRTTHGTLFTLSEYSRFRATSCTLRSTTEPRTERYLTLFRHFRFRATSCTLRCTTKPRTERNKVRWFLRVFFQTTHYQPSRALFISCNKLHATIHDQPTHGTLFNPFPACPISCNKLHATIHDQTTHGTK